MPYLRKRVKKGIIFENFGKNIQNLKIYEKVHPHSCDYHMHKTSRMCPVISVRWAYHQSKEVVCLDPGLSLVGWYLGGPWYQGGADNSSALNVHSVIFQLKTNIQQHLTKYYLEKCMDHMNDGSYQLLKYDPTTKIKAKTLKQLKALWMAMSLLIIKNNIWNLLTFLHLDFMVNQKYKNQEFLFILLHCTILTINT